MPPDQPPSRNTPCDEENTSELFKTTPQSGWKQRIERNGADHGKGAQRAKTTRLVPEQTLIEISFLDRHSFISQPLTSYVLSFRLLFFRHSRGREWRIGTHESGSLAIPRCEVEWSFIPACTSEHSSFLVPCMSMHTLGCMIL